MKRRTPSYLEVRDPGLLTAAPLPPFLGYISRHEVLGQGPWRAIWGTPSLPLLLRGAPIASQAPGRGEVADGK